MNTAEQVDERFTRHCRPLPDYPRSRLVSIFDQWKKLDELETPLRVDRIRKARVAAFVKLRKHLERMGHADDWEVQLYSSDNRRHNPSSRSLTNPELLCKRLVSLGAEPGEGEMAREMATKVRHLTVYLDVQKEVEWEGYEF